MKEELYRDTDDDSVMTDSAVIKRRAKRRGFSISHRAFRSYGVINRGLWWFGDQEFRFVSPEEGLNNEEAIEWLR